MSRSRLAGALAALALPLALVAATSATPASAATTGIATSQDQWGDVRSTADRHLTLREKRSIDMGRITLDKVDRKTRVTIRFRKVIRTPKFDQMFFMTLTERKDAPGGQWMTNAGFTTKTRSSGASYMAMDGSDWEICHFDVTLHPAKREIAATLPARCTAKGPVRVRVYSYTGHFDTDAPPYSADRHVLSRRHTIWPN